MKRIFLLTISLFLAGCQAPLHVKQSRANPHPSAIQKPGKTVQERIKQYLLEEKINGGVAIIQKNRVIFNEGIGYANLTTQTPNTALTTYLIGSITKTLVATSIMQLQEKGKLSIQDPVEKYIPQFPNGKKIKLIHLLTHTSGIMEPIWHKGDTTPEKLVKEIAKRPVSFSAGAKWDYQDANYIVLGYILEKVTGGSLHTYISDNIFTKAGIKHSGFITAQNRKPFSSSGYTKGLFSTTPDQSFNIYMLYGCGDVYMTPYDLCLYDEALMSGKLVSPQSLKLILTPASKSNYGLGLYAYKHAAFSRGVLGGWESLHVYYYNRIIISVLLNVRNKDQDIHKLVSGLYTVLTSHS